LHASKPYHRISLRWQNRDRDITMRPEHVKTTDFRKHLIDNDYDNVSAQTR